MLVPVRSLVRGVGRSAATLSPERHTRVALTAGGDGRARSPLKQAAPLAGPAVVIRRACLADTGRTKAEPTAVTAPPPANDDRKPAEKKSAIVTTASQKQLKLDRASRRREDRPEDPEATARVKAFFARMVRPGGALPPGKP